ncbi:MAG: hypothetical protein ACOC56_02835 [Atribacterota bacterium]
MKNKIDKNKIKRSCLTGKIANGKEIILKNEAKEYLKKQGFNFVNKKKVIPIEIIIEKLNENGYKIIPKNEK